MLDAIAPGVSELELHGGRGFPHRRPAGVDQPVGLHRRRRLRDFDNRRRGRAQLADALVADERVKPIGLGARDSLRLEAGLPLYGHDIDGTTTPVMAGLQFAINKRRRAEGGFPGAQRILAEIQDGPPQNRVGFEVEGRQPVREGGWCSTARAMKSGGSPAAAFRRSLQRPIAMGYVAAALAEAGTALKLEQRGKLFEARVAAMPFVPHRYHRKGATA